MKCIKYYRPHGGHVDRVSDEKAAAEVARGVAMYAPKHLWKLWKLKEAAEST